MPHTFARRLERFGDAIPRLYAAGERGSSFGHLYMSGSNITECFVNGCVAGREVMALQPWDELAPNNARCCAKWRSHND